MIDRFAKKSIGSFIVLSTVMSLILFPLPVSGGYQFTRPSTVWADDFRNGLDPNWGNYSSGNGGNMTISNTIYYSSPSSLRMCSYGNTYAYAVGPLNKMVSPNSNGSLCSIDYTKNYTVQFYFYLPDSNNHWIAVFMNRHIITVIDYGTDFTCRSGSTNTLIVTLNTTTWYRMTYWVDVTHSKYYVDVYNTNLRHLVVTGFPCNFQGGSYTDPFMLGDFEHGSSNYGQAFWDDFQINFTSLQVTNVVFRLLAVEGYYQISMNSEIPSANFTEYMNGGGAPPGAPDYSHSGGQQIPMKSSQYLILALTKFTNWKNYTWGGVKYTSYIHLLSADPNRFAATNQYYRGNSTRANVVNEIRNFLGQNDPNAYTVRMFHYAGHAGFDGRYYLALGNPANPEKLYDADLNATLNSGALSSCSSVLVILDCCHSGGFIPALAKSGRVILTSCNPGELSGGWAWLNKPAPTPGYWSWFTGNEAPAPAPKAYAVGIINALFSAADADNDGWLSASELFDDAVSGANTTTMNYWPYRAGLMQQRTQSPQKSYGVVSGDLPVVMSKPYYWIAQPNPSPPPKFTLVQMQTGFHTNPFNVTFQPQPPGKSYSSYRSDMSRTGFSPDPPLPPLSLLWSTSLLSPIESSVVTREEGVIVSTKSGVISMLDIRTGRMLWSLNLNGPIFATPTIANGTVFVATTGGGGGGGGGCLYAIEFSTGTIMWEFQLPPETGICASPAVSDGRCIVGTIYGGGGGGGSGWICAFNQTTGMPLWNYTTLTQIWSSPAVADGRVFFAERGNPPLLPAFVYALNESTGAVMWSSPPIPNSLIVSTPAVCGGGGAGGGRVFIGAESTPGGPSVYAISESSGSIEWSFPTLGNVSSSPAVDPNTGLVVVGDQAGYVYGLTQASGGLVWYRQLSPSPINMSSAGLTNNRLVFIGSTDSRLYCINETNGYKLWNYTTGAEIVSSPAIVGDHILIGSTDGNVYCFGPAFPLHDVTVNSASASPTVVNSGGLVTITSTVANNGNVPETFNVTFYYNNTLLWNWPVHPVPARIGSNRVTLGPGATMTTTYSWNTTGMLRGNYNVVVIADFLPYETNDSNNIAFTNTLTIKAHDVAVSGLSPFKTVVGQGCSMRINVTVANQGDFPETFNVTLYANGSHLITLQKIASQNVTLSSLSSTTIAFLWNSTGMPKGNYTLSAYAWPVPGETYVANNEYMSSVPVYVAIVGDIASIRNGKLVDIPDGRVDMHDVSLIAGKFDTRQGQQGWDPNCDMTSSKWGVPDGRVDMHDVSLIASQFGKRDP
jgi:outer membrane protein assembly factor BamB